MNEHPAITVGAVAAVSFRGGGAVSWRRCPEESVGAHGPWTNLGLSEIGSYRTFRPGAIEGA